MKRGEWLVRSTIGEVALYPMYREHVGRSSERMFRANANGFEVRSFRRERPRPSKRRRR